MQLLARERETLERYLPGLDSALAERPLLELEGADSPGIALFREAGGAALLIPTDYQGKGADALEAVRVTRAIASRSPSLAVATTMHQFSVATLVEMDARSDGLEGLFLQAVAQQNLLMASGFAEGRTGQGILSPTMSAAPAEKGIVLNGSKRPCSLARSMDLLTASLAVPKESGDGHEVLVALIPAKSEGLECRPFWKTWVLAGAESDEVVLNNVFVPDRLLFPAGDSSQLDPIQVRGFLWFELLISASYLGMATALVERAVRGKRGEASDRAQLGIEIEGAMAALEGVARSFDAAEEPSDMLARMLFVRYAVQGAIERATMRAAEILGGMAFMDSSDVAYLIAATRPLAFHPPSRGAMAGPLADYLEGAPLTIP